MTATDWTQEDHATQTNLYGAHIYLRESLSTLIKAKGLLSYEPRFSGIVGDLEELIFDCECAQKKVMAEIIANNNSHKEAEE